MTPTKKDDGHLGLQTPIEVLKSRCVNFLSGIHTLCALTERLIQKPLDKISVFTVGEFVQDLKQNLLALEAMPNDHAEFIRNYPGLGSTDQLYEANRAEMENLLESQGYDKLKDRVAELIGMSKSAIVTFESQERRKDQASLQSSAASLNASPNINQSWPEQSAQKEFIRGPDKNTSVLTGNSGSSCQKLSIRNMKSSESEDLSEAKLTVMRKFDESTTTTLKKTELANKTDGGQPVQNSHNSVTSVKNVKSDENSCKSPANMPGSSQRISSSISKAKLHPAETKQLVLLDSKNGSVPTTPGAELLTLNPNFLRDIHSCITPFNGNRAEYHIFKKTFDMFVDRNPDLSQEMKQILLLRLIDPETRSMVATPDITADGYTQLRENLDRQFNRNRKDAIDDLILQMKCHKFHQENFDQMEKDLNKFSVITNALRVRGCSIDDPLTLHTFIMMLPEQIMPSVLRKERAGSHTLKDLIDYTHDVISMKREMHGIKERRRSERLFRAKEDGTSEHE